MPSCRITDILHRSRAITADTALRLGHYFGNGPRLWLDLQSQYDLAMLERERGKGILRQVQPATIRSHQGAKRYQRPAAARSGNRSE